MTKTLAAMVLCGLATAAMGQDIVLYQQAPHTPGAVGANGLSTFEGGLPTPPPMYDREAADDFVVPAGPGWIVNRLVINALQFTPGDTNAVTGADLRFFNGAGGGVGAPIRAGT